MPRPTDDEWDDDWESETDEFDGEEEASETIDCPHCGEAVHEDASRCPHCENYLSDEDAPNSPKPVWIVIGFVLCVIVVMYWLTAF